MNTRAFFAGVSASALILLSACNTANAKLQTDGETYIRANISDLSTIGASLGGSFRVTDIEWFDDDTAIVTYEDGHMQFKGRADVSMDSDGVVTATRIRLEPGEGGSSSQSSDAMNTLSSSASSVMNGSSSSASSVKNSSSSSLSSSHSMGHASSSSVSSSAASARARAKLGEFCGGIAGFLCEDGLTCQYEGTYPDAGGTCVR